MGKKPKKYGFHCFIFRRNYYNQLENVFHFKGAYLYDKKWKIILYAVAFNFWFNSFNA